MIQGREPSRKSKILRLPKTKQTAALCGCVKNRVLRRAKTKGKRKMQGQKKRGVLTPVSILHYIRLVYRSALFLALLVIYLYGRIKSSADHMISVLRQQPVVVRIIWVVFVVEMILRFFPSRLESPGSQKQFRKNYIKSGHTEIVIQDNNGTMLVILVWICFNLIFGWLYMAGLLDDGIMLLLCCFYSVCDLICILFFCPFQTFFLKNKCCSTCRIYNWDYAMMFTPLFFVRDPYSTSLLVLSLALMFRWEITFFRYPEFFSEKTNEYLHCKNCTEKLCTHKTHLHSLWKTFAKFTAERTKRLRK